MSVISGNVKLTNTIPLKIENRLLASKDVVHIYTNINKDDNIYESKALKSEGRTNE